MVPVTAGAPRAAADYSSQQPLRRTHPHGARAAARGPPGAVVRRRCWAAAAPAWAACGSAPGGCGGAGGGRRPWPAGTWGSAWSGWTWRCGPAARGGGGCGEPADGTGWGSPGRADAAARPWQMTGLDVEKDQILEMACLITDCDLNVLAEVSGTGGACGSPGTAPLPGMLGRRNAGPGSAGIRWDPPGSAPGAGAASLPGLELLRALLGLATELSHAPKLL